jgi:hypothetical protein
MTLALKIVSGLFALLFLSMGVGFMFDPSGSAVGVGLEPLGELGLNTLRGDMGGMFLASTALIGLGIFLKKSDWLLAVAVLMLLIAAGRVIGFAVDGNPAQPALMAFGFEIVIAAVLFATSRRLTANE